MLKIYGASDDLIEIEGHIREELGKFGTDDDDKGVLVFFDDGTLLEVKYGKLGDAIWAVNLINKGPEFIEIKPCIDSNADPYSDVAILSDKIKWCVMAGNWLFSKAKKDIIK